MAITSQEREQVVTELKHFVHELNLNDQQKEKLQSALAETRERVAEYLKDHPDTPKADIIAKLKEHRALIRQRFANFLSPEQLTKWDAEMTKAKVFLGYKMEA